MAKKKQSKGLPLLEEINKFQQTSLLEADEALDYKVGDYISDNLKHELRPYQAQALYALNYTQTRDKKYNQLLFNMATGSGKTDTMASVILYMYVEYGYQNFVFVANTNAVVSKTRENFLNDNSPKYLFNTPISIDGQRVEIRAVNRFPVVQKPGIIYLKLTTIQSLANELGSSRENGLTYEELKKNKLVVLADEAHHFNASTKSQKVEEKSWEILLDKVRNSNSDNRQFEFTATIDIDKELVYEKYKDKIVYKYDLDKFMNDGYSKNVYRLEAQNEDSVKMLNAVLLSQYRKRIAQKVGVENFKPVILFKSNRVANSIQAKDDFLEMIAELNAEKLANFLAEQNNINHSTTLKKAYNYWMKQDFAETVVELKRDFKPLTTINVNDTAKEGVLGDKNDFNNLNTLEDINNPLRTVFAVAKLTEGWDVLNLYDIVRIGEQPVTANQTNSEAQLIGRGARYNPFVYKGERSYTRRFDRSNPDLELLESLFYHTINDVKYINNLLKSFDKMNLVSESDNDNDYSVYTATVKDSFKQSKAYKFGKLYHNQLEAVPESAYNNLGSYGFNRNTITIDMNDSILEHAKNQESKINEASSREEIIADFSKVRDLRLLKKAMSRDKFFRFAELSKWLPSLKSLDEFMTSRDWLGNLRINAIVPYNRLDSQQNNSFRLLVVVQALAQVKSSIKRNYLKKRGTNRFDSVPLKDIVIDYTKRVSNSSTGVQALIKPEPMDKDDWFVYDQAIVDGLEKNLIEMIRGLVTELKKEYKEVFLIRNEETINKLKIYDFDNDGSKDILHYEGFMPDFLLYLDNGQVTYQLFIEPKGDQLLERDSWKEKLLKKINPENIELIGENDDVRLYGVKFFRFGNGREIETEITEILE
ncbi:DEAD/DEAH box helicase family protein [Ligilactobacillus faecis]|uniref:DEAD/DEAH box helicase family protein n=1 Tax=Ligilactobacillus faecis TaxID=762833 RepID=UPI002468F116|nr:DEAD/DEAH box helicase family protein [Ligilactobacillus faecis]WGN90357.1 DEAD/DEAH box helicase family protein [Ligilactobacillus faecis]